MRFLRLKCIDVHAVGRTHTQMMHHAHARTAVNIKGGHRRHDGGDGPTHRGVGSHGALRDLQCSHRPGATFKGDDGARFVAGIERTTRSSGQQTVTIENGDAFAEQRRNGFGHSLDIAGTGQSLT